MIIGDKIRLIKPMGVFTNIGEICEVIDITEDGVICFKFGGLHLGCMSYDEFTKYFEIVNEPVKREWTEWTETYINFYDFDGLKINIPVWFRENGKNVQVKSAKLKGEATCCKCDKFNIDKGFELAKQRLIIKHLKKKVERLAKNM